MSHGLGDQWQTTLIYLAGKNNSSTIADKDAPQGLGIDLLDCLSVNFERHL